MMTIDQVEVNMKQSVFIWILPCNVGAKLKMAWRRKKKEPQKAALKV